MHIRLKHILNYVYFTYSACVQDDVKYGSLHEVFILKLTGFLTFILYLRCGFNAAHVKNRLGTYL